MLRVSGYKKRKWLKEESVSSLLVYVSLEMNESSQDCIHEVVFTRSVKTLDLLCLLRLLRRRRVRRLPRICHVIPRSKGEWMPLDVSPVMRGVYVTDFLFCYHVSSSSSHHLERSRFSSRTKILDGSCFFFSQEVLAFVSVVLLLVEEGDHWRSQSTREKSKEVCVGWETTKKEEEDRNAWRILLCVSFRSIFR